MPSTNLTVARSKEIMTILICLVAVSLVSTFADAQEASRVRVSNSDPTWGETITIEYDAPRVSDTQDRDIRDTVYCTATIEGVRPPHTLLIPVQRDSSSARNASLLIPDSTWRVTLWIATPQNVLPGGYSGFTCRTTVGEPTPGYESASYRDIDGGLARDLAAYPWHYRAYFQNFDMGHLYSDAGAFKRSDAEWRTIATGWIRKLRAKPDTTLEYWITLAGLYFKLGNDSLAKESMENAAKTDAVGNIVNDPEFWGRFIYPTVRDGKYRSIDVNPLLPLFARYPRTAMVQEWLNPAAYDTTMEAETYRHIAAAWQHSNNVDVLREIARAFANPNNPVYSPREALIWCDRAEHALLSGAGFYSREYVYGRGSRWEWIAATKIGALGALGEIDHAAKYAHDSLPADFSAEGRRQIAFALGQAYLQGGRIPDAERAYGLALSLGSKAGAEGLDSLYTLAKQGNESLSQFSERIAREYGTAIALPAIPDFRYRTLDGASGTLYGLRGKVVVLECWFTTCPGCVEEKPALNRLVDDYASDTNVVFLSIALNDPATLKAFSKKHPSKFTIVPNGSGICTKLGVTGYPTHIIIDKAGKTLSFEVGGSETADEDLQPKIDTALGKS